MKLLRAPAMLAVLMMSLPAQATTGPRDDPDAAITGPVLTPGPVVTADPWAEAVAAFANADAAHPSRGGVVFVGSSSLRLWDDLERRFKDYSALNRGFGGSTLADCIRHLDRLVLPHDPRLVVVYAGDNDLAEGRSPQQVFDDFKALSERIHKRLPKTQVVFVSIKPSPARADLLDRVRQSNTLIRDYAENRRNMQYVDVFTPMLGDDGQPRGELFRGDALHLNSDGYALWYSLISPVLLIEEKPSMLKDADSSETANRGSGKSDRASAKR